VLAACACSVRDCVCACVVGGLSLSIRGHLPAHTPHTHAQHNPENERKRRPIFRFDRKKISSLPFRIELEVVLNPKDKKNLRKEHNKKIHQNQMEQTKKTDDEKKKKRKNYMQTIATTGKKDGLIGASERDDERATIQKKSGASSPPPTACPSYPRYCLQLFCVFFQCPYFGLPPCFWCDSCVYSFDL